MKDLERKKLTLLCIAFKFDLDRKEFRVVTTKKNVVLYKVVVRPAVLATKNDETGQGTPYCMGLLMPSGEIFLLGTKLAGVNI
jgi:hypothetical protein